MGKKSVEELARKASEKYNREITVEQYMAVDYFAREEASAFMIAKTGRASPEKLKARSKEIEENCRKSLLETGNLDGLVRNYSREMRETSYRNRMKSMRVAEYRERRIPRLHLGRRCGRDWR